MAKAFFIDVSFPQYVSLGGQKVLEAGKRTYTFYIYNNLEKTDDEFNVEVTVLGKDTDEMLEKQARFKLGGMIVDRKGYSNEKIRKPGEERIVQK